MRLPIAAASISIATMASLLAASAAASYPLMQLNSLNAYPTALCLDGTPAGYYFAPGFGSGADKYYIDHQGGGWCETPEKCLARSKTPHGSSNDWSAAVEWRNTRLFSEDPEENPLMYNWNKVYVSYCDGSSFTSNVQVPIEVDGVQLHFRGNDIVEAAMTDLLESKNLKTASDVVVGGCSAGGLAALLHCDRWAERIRERSPDAKVACAPESGFFIDYDSNTLQPTLRDLMMHAVMLHNPVLPSNCFENESNLFKCIYAETVTKHIETPLFVMQTTFDDWARGAIQLSDGNEDEINSFGATVLDTILQSALVKEQNGGFIDSCTRHCNGFDVEIDGVKKTEALKLWYEGKVLGNGQRGRQQIHTTASVQMLDDVHIQDASYPCDDCCGIPVLPELPTCERDERFGYWMLYPSDPSKVESDWSSNWDIEREFASPPLSKDPLDDRLEVRLKGKVSIANGTAILADTSELYVNSTTPQGFENVEVTVELKYLQDGTIMPASGITLIVPTNYEGPGDDACKARSYRAQILRDNGRVAFQKEGSKNVFTARNYGSFNSLIGSTFSADWIALKFVVHSQEDGGSVRLEFYIDVKDGQGWQPAHSMVDEPGQWATIKDIPSECVFSEDDVIHGGGSYVGLRNIGSEETMLAVKNFSVRNVLPDMYDLNCGALSTEESTAPPTIASSSEPSPKPSLKPSPGPSLRPSLPPTRNPTPAPSTGDIVRRPSSGASKAIWMNPVVASIVAAATMLNMLL